MWMVWPRSTHDSMCGTMKGWRSDCIISISCGTGPRDREHQGGQARERARALRTWNEDFRCHSDWRASRIFFMTNWRLDPRSSTRKAAPKAPFPI